MDSLTTILHLNDDLLRVIMLLVVASAGGGTYLARAIVVSKKFAKFGEIEEILKIANFDNFSLSGSIENFQHIRGLLIKCAEAGNDGARYILAKVILVSFSQLLEKEPNCSKLQHISQASTSMAVEKNDVRTFLSYFRTKRANGRNPNGSKYYHFELVWYFVKRCYFSDSIYMLPHLENYVKCFGPILTQNGVLELLEKFSYMLITVGAVLDACRERKSQIEPQVRGAGEVVVYIRDWYITHHLMGRTNELPRVRWEELKKEIKYMTEELVIIRNKFEVMETGSLVPDMEERFFYYIAFDEPVTREIDIYSDPYLYDLWSYCRELAIRYAIIQDEAIAAFREIFSIVLS